jgi:hypothetical protein
MKPSQAIETVVNQDGTNDLLLCGISNLFKASYDYSAAVYNKLITEDNSISNVVGYGEDNKFFYILETYGPNNKVVRYEHGLGYAYQQDDKAYFKRFLQIYSGSRVEEKSVCFKQTDYFPCDKDLVTVLRSTLPEHYFMCLYEDNCVLSSTGPFVASSIKIKENSFLARVNDNDLSSVSFDSKTFSDIIAEALNKYAKQLLLKTSRLSVNKLSVKQLQLEPSSDTSVKKGTFIYDETTDTVKFYNGSKWRTLLWAEDESE